MHQHNTYICINVRRCIGTGQHLKNRYGNGYILEIKLKNASLELSESSASTEQQYSRQERKENVISFVKRLFVGAEIHETFEDRIIFAIAQDSINALSETFRALEEGL